MLQISLRTFLLCCFCLVLMGCQPNEYDQIINDSEGLFDSPLNSPRELIIVKCVLQPLEMPANQNIYQLPFWTDQVAMIPDPVSANAARLGFPVSQVQAWQQNGLIVKVAPMSYYSTLIQNLQGLGGVPGDQTTHRFKNQMEVADYYGYDLTMPVSLFMQEPDESVRSYELPQGYPAFRVYCQPWLMNTQNRIMNMKISPQLHLPTPRRVEIDEFGLPQPILDPLKIVFEQITLAGLIPPDHFICISSQQPSEEAKINIGELFLKRDVGADNYQLVYIIMPKIEIVRRVDKSN